MKAKNQEFPETLVTISEISCIFNSFNNSPELSNPPRLFPEVQESPGYEIYTRSSVSSLDKSGTPLRNPPKFMFDNENLYTSSPLRSPLRKSTFSHLVEKKERQEEGGDERKQHFEKKLQAFKIFYDMSNSQNGSR